MPWNLGPTDREDLEIFRSSAFINFSQFAWTHGRSLQNAALGAALEALWRWKKAPPNAICLARSTAAGFGVPALASTARARSQSFVLSDGQELPHWPGASHTLPPEGGTPNLSPFPSTRQPKRYAGPRQIVPWHRRSSGYVIVQSFAARIHMDSW
jgi:hypothetical protein